jgi:hypothetical protein
MKMEKRKAIESDGEKGRALACYYKLPNVEFDNGLGCL